MQINRQQMFVRSQSLFLFILCITIISAFSLQKIFQFLPQSQPSLSQALVDGYQFFLHPKPTERSIFMVLGLFVPLLTLLLTRNQGLFDNQKFPNLTTMLLPCIISFLLFMPLVHSDFFDLLRPKKITFFKSNSKLIISCFILASIWCSFCIREKFKGFMSSKLRAFVLLNLISVMLLLIAAWRVSGINGVTDNGAWFTHFDAVIYATSQVLAGKTLLVDLPSQYGLFPEVIAPLFKFIQASILNFSLLFAALEIISMLGLFFLLLKLVRNVGFLFLGGLSLLLVTYLTFLHFAGSDDRYYQYWPIRFFWPAMSVLFFYFFAANKSYWRSGIISALAAIGTFWVMDTGLFIFLAFTAYLTTRFLIALNQKAQGMDYKEKNKPLSYPFYFIALCLHLIITLSLFSLFLGALWIKAQQPLHFSWIIQYQKIFYGLGFAMLSLPKEIHPWMSILGIYLLGLIISLISFYQSKKSIRAEVIFFLSTLGLGLFIYYEARSHVYNLITVCWPALLIMIIAADSTLNQIRQQALGRTAIWLPITAMVFLLTCSLHLSVQIPSLFKEAKNKFLTRNTENWSVFKNELDFIKKHTQAQQECYILSKRQGMYYFESGLRSPIDGPGLVEMLLKSDFERVHEKLFSGRINCLFLAVTKENRTPFFNPEELKKIYKIADESSEHTLLYLIPKDA